MNLKITALSVTCALALAACGDESPSPAQDRTPPATAPATTAPPPAAPVAEVPVPATTPADEKPAAVVTDCSTKIEGNDAMQFNVGSITVPSSCSEFTITLEHVGKMPKAAMGHNVVISLASDREPIAKDGAVVGLDSDYIKPGDDRVIAHTKMIGGGETTSVTFSVSGIQGPGPYEFFCSFPGHWMVMRGAIKVE